MKTCKPKQGDTYLIVNSWMFDNIQRVKKLNLKHSGWEKNRYSHSRCYLKNWKCTHIPDLVTPHLEIDSRISVQRSMYKNCWGTSCVVQTLCCSGRSWELGTGKEFSPECTGKEFYGKNVSQPFNISNSNTDTYLSIGDWLTKLWLMHTMEYYGTMKEKM